MDALIQDTLSYLKREFELSDTILVTKEEFEFFKEKRTSCEGQLETKNREFDKEAPQIFCSERVTIAERQSANENKKFEAQPAQSKADSSSCLYTPTQRPPTVSLEPLAKPAGNHLEEMRKIVAKASPQLKLTSDVLDDSEAKKISQLWKEELTTIQVAVLCFGEAGKNLEFLKSVAKAIDALIVPAKVVDAIRFEGEKKWGLFFKSSPLKLILAPDIYSWKSTELATFYRENPATSRRTLGEAPLLFIQPAISYLKNPKEKKLLWKAIVSHLSS